MVDYKKGFCLVYSPVQQLQEIILGTLRNLT